MKNFIAILLAMLTLLNGGSNVIITEENIGDYLASDCASVAYFIIDNLSLFAEEITARFRRENCPLKAHPARAFFRFMLRRWNRKVCISISTTKTAI